MTPLEPGQLGVMRVHALMTCIFLLGMALVGETGLAAAFDLPFGLVLAPIAVLLVYPVLIGPARRYRAWGYDMGDEELRIAHGVWTQVETHVPLARVQHIDVSQGPIERSFKVCRLILHTAGTANSRIVLPGLARGTAESIRDEVRARIRLEEA